MAKLVRLKPFNPRRGFTLRSYTLKGVKIDESSGWFEVPDELAAEFAEVHSDPSNPDTPYAFDVMTPDDAVRLEAEQRKLAAQKATAEAPIKVVRRIRPVDDASAAALDTHYGRPPGTSANRARTHLARPDESEASRNIGALTQGAVPGAPTLNEEEEGGEEYDLAAADLGMQVAKQQGVRAAEQAPFLDGSQMTARVGDPDKRNPDPRNIGRRQLGAFDDTPFVDGSRDAVIPPQDTDHGVDVRNPDPRNTGLRSAGAFDDTPFVDGSRDAVVPPIAVEKTLEDEAQMQPEDSVTPPRAAATRTGSPNPNAPRAPVNTTDPSAQAPGAPGTADRKTGRTRKTST